MKKKLHFFSIALIVITGSLFFKNICNSSEWKTNLIQVAEEKSWTFNANCQIRCENGECKQICKAGTVFAYSKDDAIVKATAELRSEASNKGGTIVDGTISISVELH